MNSKQQFRIKAVFLLFVLGAGVLSSSLYWTQIKNGHAYASKADQQYIKPKTSIFNRGSIYFETKDGTKVSGATVASGYYVYMNPKILVNASQVYEALSAYLKLDKNDFLKKAAKSNDTYEELVHKLDQNTAASIQGLNIKGLTVVPESWRTYPGEEMAAHELGIIGENSLQEVTGRYGLERAYESVLQRPGIASSQSVFAQLFSGFQTVLGSDKTHGDIVSTIEPTVEDYLEKILSETTKTWHPDEIGGVIMDPKTGEIVAMSSLPTYNPNDLSSVKNASIFTNSLVEHVYEMGSILKPLTMATGLDTGAITASSTYDDTGTMTLSGKKISNYDGKARGVIDMQQILSQSLNVGAATVALKVGKDNFAKYFKSYGLGDKTGIDEPNEATGIINNLNTGRDVEIATAAYGQGIAMSPVAITRALAILANDGKLVVPHLVKEIDYTDGTSKIIKPVISNTLLSKTSTDEVTRMLVTVVDVALKKGAIKMDHYSMAAKTGTAQIPDHVNGGYYPDRYLHSFFGYFPAYNPRFIVFLYQIYPKGAQYASDTLTNPYNDLAKFLINYYSISPDR